MEIIFEPYAVRMTIKSATDRSPEYWGRSLCAFMEALAGRTTDAGPCVIGHLKGFAQAPGLGFLKISVVSSDHPADLTGDLNGRVTALSLDLNVLVYGHNREVLADLTRKTVQDPGKPWAGQITAASSDGSGGQ